MNQHTNLVIKTSVGLQQYSSSAVTALTSRTQAQKQASLVIHSVRARPRVILLALKDTEEYSYGFEYCFVSLTINTLLCLTCNLPYGDECLR